MNKIDKITGVLYCIVMLSMTMFPPFIIGAHEGVRYSFIINYRITDLYCQIDTAPESVCAQIEPECRRC